MGKWDSKRLSCIILGMVPSSQLVCFFIKSCGASRLTEAVRQLCTYLCTKIPTMKLLLLVSFIADSV